MTDDLKTTIDFFKAVDPYTDSVIFSYDDFSRQTKLKLDAVNSLLIKLTAVDSRYPEYNKTAFRVNGLPNAKSITDKDVTHINALFIDHDKESTDVNYVHYSTLLELELPPHIILRTRSTGRWQAFWLVDNLPKWAFKSCQQKLIALFPGCDKSIINSSRLMRFPGSVNIVEGVKHITELMHSSYASPRYNFLDRKGLITWLFGGRNAFFTSLSGSKGVDKAEYRRFNNTLLEPLSENELNKLTNHLIETYDIKNTTIAVGEDPFDLMVFPFKNENSSDIIKKLEQQIVYLANYDLWFDLVSEKMFTDKNMRVLLGAKTFATMMGGMFRTLMDKVYVPSGDRIIDNNLNTYRDTRVKPVEGDVSWFEEYLNYYFEEEDHHIVRKWLAITYSRPEIKLEWALMVTGDQGSGKSSLFQIAKALYGNKNFKTTRGSELGSRFNTFLEDCKILHIEELDSGNKRLNYGNSKMIVSNSEIEVEEKGKPKRTLTIYVNAYISSNDERPLYINEQDDRKYCIIRTKRSGAVFTADEWNDHLTNHIGGLGYYLSQIDINDNFDHRYAPLTVAKREMLTNDISPGSITINTYITMAIRQGIPVLSTTVFSKHINERIKIGRAAADKMMQRAIGRYKLKVVRIDNNTDARMFVPSDSNYTNEELRIWYRELKQLAILAANPDSELVPDGTAVDRANDRS